MREQDSEQIALNQNGSVSDNTDAVRLALFEKSCCGNSIIFVNMSDVFIEAYNSSHVLPCGFLNTAAGAGRLNRTGRRLISGELFRQIRNLESGEAPQ